MRWKRTSRAAGLGAGLRGTKSGAPSLGSAGAGGYEAGVGGGYGTPVAYAPAYDQPGGGFRPTGYAEMGKSDNSAGWILTTVVYALGGRMEQGTGSKAKATLNNAQTVAALNLLHHMRWTDNSMGSNFDYGWSEDPVAEFFGSLDAVAVLTSTSSCRARRGRTVGRRSSASSWPCRRS